MNFGEMKTRLRALLGNVTVDDVSNETLGQYINDSLVDIVDRFRFHRGRCIKTFTTTPGTNRYSIPSGASAVLMVWDVTNKREIPQGDAHTLAEKVGDTTRTGLPLSYVRMRDWFDFYPIPSGSYVISVFHRTDPSTLVEGSDSPTIPSSWHRGVLLYARWIHYDLVSDAAKASSSWAAWVAWSSSKSSEIEDEITYSELSVRVPVLADASFNDGASWLPTTRFLYEELR